MKQITRNWHFMRILRAALALIVLVQGISSANSINILFGASFLGMAVFNVGCCAGGQCDTYQSTNTDQPDQAVILEEVLAPKLNEKK